MAIQDPQFDIPYGISGAADIWDEGIVGFILTSEFFPEAITTGGVLRYWNGASWVNKPLKYWNGSSWVTKSIKSWNGTAWI
jgi:hypothetical protein